MKVLITGANGLLGQKLCALLIRKNIEFLATSKGPCRISNGNGEVNYESMDIVNQDDITRVTGTWNPDIIINTAAMTNVDQCVAEPELCHQLNVDAVGYLVDYCESQNCKLIHLSTDFIFDGKNGPYREDDEPRPLSIYGQSKLDGELIIQKSSIEWAIVRTVLVYGVTADMSRSNIVLWVKKSLTDGMQINVVDDQWRTPTLAEDLALGCYLIAEKGAQGVFNISGSEMMTPYDIAMATAKFFKLDASMIKRADANSFTQPAKRPPKTGFIIDKARKILGYNPNTFKNGLAILQSQLQN